MPESSAPRFGVSARTANGQDDSLPVFMRVSLERLDEKDASGAARIVANHAEAAESQLAVEARRLEGIAVEEDQLLARAPRPPLGFLHEPAAEAAPTRTVLEPEQLDVQ